MARKNHPRGFDPMQESKSHHLKETALEKLHHIEDSALEAYHTIEDHDARELRQDVRGVLGHLAQWSISTRDRFKAWYLAQPLYLQIVYGLTLVPLLGIIGVATLMLVKFGGPLLFATVLVIKLSITLIKTLFFIGYILYKILKTIIMWYYILTRLYFGRKAKNRRFAMARVCDFAVEPASEAERFSFHCQKKHLYINHDEKGRISVLFSYLRYALVGHLDLFENLKNNWRDYLSLWKQVTRDRVKAALAPLGDSLFTPHKLGPHINDDRILVPGDAELLEIRAVDDRVARLTFRIRWVDWHFKLQKAVRFLSICREHQEDHWSVEAPFKAIERTDTAMLADSAE